MNVAAPSLALDYRPGRPHGWFDPGRPMTFGGHTGAEDFVVGDRSYRISLLPFDQPTDRPPNPVYAETPSDPALRFRETLAAAFGAHYTFRYLSRLPGRTRFSVQSYSVSTAEPSESEPMRFGADLYVVYDCDPQPGGRRGTGTMRWIQVSSSVGHLGGPPPQTGDPGQAGNDGAPRVDGTGPGNPFYRFGGSTSVRGQRVGNFTYGVEVPYLPLPGEGDSGALSFLFTAETFLAQDTGHKDAAGREIVDIFGGIKYGWQLRETSGGRA
ncbi:hypothetical protein [Embleya sp. NBC_00896]|uniref:hypothetical protein n=1 Tax=Embleya sp. NBC_00896 TaxID=2975961 RepID=UPI0038686D99|nr:hypothetical protein OG928_18120 [Embleya sp. NBC_00896]